MEDREIILEVKDLQKDYPVMRGLIFQKESSGSQPGIF